MDKRERSEAIDHALKELWRLHYDLEESGDIRLDKRLETIIRKLYELKDISNCGYML